MATPADNVVPLTGNSLIDGLTWGAAWDFAGGAHTLTYSLSLNDNPNGGPWTEELSDAVRLALAEWSNVANLSFVETGSGGIYDQSSADLAFILTGDELQSESEGIVALGLPPSPSFAETLLASGGGTRADYRQPEGDIGFDNYYSGFSYLYSGGVGLTIMLHEIGHALGLKHTDDGPAGRPTFASLGISNLDSNLYTVMSYTSASGSQLGTNQISGNAATPMPLDILAIQQIYGANTSYRTGDDTYYIYSDEWFSSADNVSTIWDAGGSDTLNVTFPNFLLHADAVIDLREGHYSSILGTTVAIAYNVTIENAVGSDGNDRLTGNAAGNRLDGDVGHDTLEGRAGSDTLDGGVGFDTANYLGSMSGYSFGLNASHQVTIADIDSGNGDDGTDTLVRIERASFVNGTVSLRSYDEATVNTFKPNDQQSPSIALTVDGGYVIAWMSSYQENDSTDIYAQRYDAIGNAIGGETRVNTHTPGYHAAPTIAALVDGSYIIAWQSLYQDGYGYGIYAQRYDTSGNAIGGETLISTYSASSQTNPAIAALDSGGYVVAWESYNQYGIFAQRYDSSCAPLGEEAQVDTSGGITEQNYPEIAALSDGGYVVVWQSSYQDHSDGSGIYARRYDASGNALGGETRINTATVPIQWFPVVSALNNGGYVVAWQSFEQDGSQWGIYAQRYDLSGNAVGVETQVNTTTTGTQNSPTIAGLADGGFLVTWSSYGVGTFAQRYDAGGNPVGGETLLTKPSEAIAAMPDGGYIVSGTWYTGSPSDIYLQRYDAAGNAVYQLTGDANANQMTWADLTGIVFDGAGGNDILTGGSGADVLNGSSGNDTLDGGSSIDIATYAGAKAGYTVTRVGAGYTVTDTNTADGDEGTDTLSGIEWLQFSDGATKLGRVLADTSGDGKSDILWRHTDGNTSLWLMNGTSVQTYGSFGQIPTAWQIAASGDLDGDGKTDLMWRHSDGSTSLWLMNGTTVQSYGAFGQIPTPWQITTTGDFNGDGKTDLMWRHTDGSTSLWLMNGTVAQGYGSFGAIPTAWQITASGDFNGDGKTDLMWRHTDGSTSLWLMNGTVAQGFGSFGAIPVTWSILDSQGDYNGDGKNDLLWRNATDGSTNLWLMNGTTVQTYGSFGQVATGWNLVDGHGDYNGDGKSDLMWRHTDGSTSLWLMNGATVQTYGSFGAIPTAWSIVAAHEDYNSDGKSDILWRHTDGSTSLWLMNGTGVQTFGSFGAIPSTWNPVAGADAGATLTGDGSANSLTGTLNNDTLIGLAGNDILSGGAGADRFVFNTALNATTNVDTLTDFRSGTDRILLDHLILTALTTGTLAATSYVAEAGAVAHDGNDYILYDTTTGNLAYDADGTDAQAAVLFATLSGHPTMVAADIGVV